MKHFIVTATYRVVAAAPANACNDEDDNDIKTIEEVEGQRWEMFQRKFGIEPLEVKVASQ